MDWFISAAHAATAAEGGAHHGDHFNPMHQFVINRFIDIHLFGYDISFTNSALWMVMATAAVTAFLLLSMKKGSYVPDRAQSVSELTYEFVYNMVRQNAGHDGMKFFPVIFTIFLFVLSLNLLGMIPLPGLGNFTVTSHIIVTFAMAAVILAGVTAVGLLKHGVRFFKLFVPSGVPVWLLPLITVLEVISYFVRVVSLSVRLFANMMAGHTMLAVFASFVVGMGILGGWLPLSFMVALMGLEILIAFLQAYVFSVLSCIYLHDALHAAEH